MGNCIRHGSSSSWAGDDWESFSSKHKKNRSRAMSFNNEDDDHENLLGKSGTVKSCLPPLSSGREVKIKMTKKDLEELMKLVGVKGLTAKEILLRLTMDGGIYEYSDDDDHHHHYHRSWRPALQSIPEVDD